MIFLAEVCRQWESATLPAKEAQVRVANVRIGVVLSREGGALQKMLTPFRLCLGGRVGSGRQFWSWIAINDLVRTLEHIIHSPELSGPGERRCTTTGDQLAVYKSTEPDASAARPVSTAGIDRPSYVGRDGRRFAFIQYSCLFVAT